MEIETLRLISRKPPLPTRKGNQQASQTTEESPPSQDREKRPNLKSKENRLPRFPPLHLPRSNSLSRNSSEANISINSSKASSKERVSTKGSIRSSSSNRRPSITHRRQTISVEREHSNENLSVPNVSAHSWIAYQMNKGKCIHGRRIHKRREMASLTKIMNLITAIQILERLNIDPQRLVVRVSKHASRIIGTTASLKTGMQLSVYDLMFGMMLPSGNDAAFCIAEYLGSLIGQKAERIEEVIDDVEGLDKLRLSKKHPVYRFLEEMNKLAKRIGMENSKFTNPHGLSQVTNFSTVDNLAKLCTYAMKNKLFSTVVNTKEYRTVTRVFSQNEQLLQEVELPDCESLESQPQEIQLSWTNTNKMLWEGWNGVKTGVTPNAGPCLAASVEMLINGEHFHILVILLSSSSMDVRWKEVKQIANWVVKQNLIY